MSENLILPSRSEMIRSFKTQQGQIAAVLPIHAPRALLRAFGFLPVEVWGPPRVDPSEGSAHLQSYICSIARNALSFIISGGVEVADLILVPHACDSLQGLGSLLIDFVKPRQPVFPLYLPRGRRECDYHFLSAELQSLFNHLAALTGSTPTTDMLLDCIHQEEEADACLAELHHCRGQIPLPQLDFYHLIRSREYLPAETFIRIANSVLDVECPSVEQRGIPIILSGIVPEPMELFRSLEKMGAWAAADDLACCGRRIYPPGRGSDPFERIASSLLSAVPDAMNGSPINARLAHLLKLAQSTGARGVVFYAIKFCEPDLFDLPLLRQGLQQAGLRTLTLEVDVSDHLSQQTLTRLEAFLEMIS